jgi:hypothetical protein
MMYEKTFYQSKTITMDPVTIITCVQIASSVAGMLSPQGPDIGDLLAIQMQMLKNISNQIAKLQDGINLIIEDIDQLKGFVKYELPSEIYKTFVTKDQVGNFAGYERAISAYLYDRVHLGIIPAFERNRNALYAKLIDIQNVRDRVLEHKDYFLAPFVARCFKIEIDLMIILYDDVITKGMFLASFIGYENWLVDMQNKDNSYSVDKNINLLKGDLEVANTNTYGFRMCKASERSEDGEFELNFGRYTKYFYDINIEYFAFKRDFNPELASEMAAQNFGFDEVESIYDELGIDKRYIPSIVSQTVESQTKEDSTELVFLDEFYNAIPGDGQKAYQVKDRFDDERFGVDRKFIEQLNDCANPSQAILTNKKYFDAAKGVETIGKQIIIPITQKKVMFEIQRKIESLKTLI